MPMLDQILKKYIDFVILQIHFISTFRDLNSLRLFKLDNSTKMLLFNICQMIKLNLKVCLKEKKIKFRNNKIFPMSIMKSSILIRSTGITSTCSLMKIRKLMAKEIIAKMIFSDSSDYSKIANNMFKILILFRISSNQLRKNKIMEIKIFKQNLRT